ncbi:MAG: hypothetical protein M3N51_08325 [Actinomycetota bacterium]|nr:hypothetical protein [Actinomycetota bacterium]
MSRRVSALVGTGLIALGLMGFGFLGVVTPAAAQGTGGETHERMHEMMDAMHGPGTGERMHQVAGAEEMMEACAAMMEMMDPGMMGRGMMDRMMGR